MTIKICTVMPVSDSQRAAAYSMKLWRSGSVLSVFFMDGTKQLISEVMEAANEWSKYANVQFKIATTTQSHLRVTFKGDGAWSYVGVDALSVPFNEPTMVLGLLEEESSREVRIGIAMHEFGHAIGLMHEHLSPNANIPWNEKAVLEYYRKYYSWSDKMTRENVLVREPTKLATEFDKYSIMLYPVPRELTLNGFEVPWQNYTLSETDKKFAASLYPKGMTYR